MFGIAIFTTCVTLDSSIIWGIQLAQEADLLAMPLAGLAADLLQWVAYRPSIKNSHFRA
jgi:hypothetical protein